MSENLKKYLVNKKVWKVFLFSFFLVISLAFIRQTFAQDYGVEAVGDGLGGVLGEGARDPRELAGRIINFSLGFLGILALGIILLAGFKWMTSGGEEEKVGKAKKLLISASIGLVIILSSWIIATFVINKLGGVVTNVDHIHNDGDTASCGCGGYMVFNNGVWGSCIGSNCGPNDNPVTCDSSSIVPGCQALDQICAEGSYCDDNCYCKKQGAIGDSCNLNTSGGVCQAGDNLCGSYLTCNPNSCLCVGSPIIIAISPVGGFCQNDKNKSCQNNIDCGGETCDLNTPNGAPDNFLTILGKNFGTYISGQTKVLFLGSNGEKEGVNPSELNPNCLNSWRDNQIIIAIPRGVSSGAIKVVNGDLSDSTNDTNGPVIPDFKVNNITRPGLCNIDPDRGLLSSKVGYQGLSLFASSAYFGNYSTNVAGLSSSFTDASGLRGEAKTPNIRAGESGSFVVNEINGREERSNYLSFVKEMEEGEGAFISSFSPIGGNAGQYVTIFGSGFGGVKGASRVFFGSTEAVYDFPEVCLNSVWQNNQIVVKVPAGLENGNFSISIKVGEKVIDSQAINPNTFKFDKNLDLKTSICKIEPVRGPVQTPVKLWGEYFGIKGSESLVKFNIAKSIPTTVLEDGRASKLELNVPIDAITGPVSVLKNGVYGNEVNFLVAECSNNSECGAQFCCPKDTYKKGQCVSSLEKCYTDVPNSVFEWSFESGFSSDITNKSDSCAGLAKFMGACFTKGCPNVPGTCSPYPGGQKIFSSLCSRDCSLVSGCGITENKCDYDNNSDRCLQRLENGQDSNCNLNKVVEVNILGKKTKLNSYCNKNNNWEIVVPSSCPDGYTKGENNKCFDLNSSCSTCSSGLSCLKVNGQERCVSSKICPSGSICDAVSNSTSGEYRCSAIEDASCDCCCTINQSARDCCSYVASNGQAVQLECGGTCGSDSSNDGAGFGRCGGCASAGDTVLKKDLACNCTNHSGQYCETEDNKFSDGYCTDCSSLSAKSCLEHSGFCCLDSKGTTDVSDDVCRGGQGDTISNDPSSSDFGYCAYYKCLEDNPNMCASSYPVKIGDYYGVEECEKTCANSDPCSVITDFNECLAEPSGRCCYDDKDSKCTLGKAIKGNSGDIGYCAYYNCTNDNKCNYTKPLKNGQYKDLANCDKYCAKVPEGMGVSCTNKKMDSCDVSVCNAPGFACLNDTGGLTPFPNCGTCCCQPVTTTNAVDSCKGINSSLSCIANKGNCSGNERGLCCGCTKDSDCGSETAIACGADTCCDSRPKVESSSPKHLQNDVCRNSIIKVRFDKIMDHTSLVDNFVLIEEKDLTNEFCETGRLITQAELGDYFLSPRQTGPVAKLINKVKSSWRLVASSFSKSYAQRVLAQTPSSDKLYCSVAGSVFLENTSDSSTVNFVPKTLLEPSTNYYILIKGDKDLNSQSGILSLNKTGFNGLGYFDSSITVNGGYVEGENITFNGRSFKNSSITKFSTLSKQSSKTGICDISRVDLEPYSYLIKTTENALTSDEDDKSGSATFDTKADKDKVFTAQALSVDGQVLRPVQGYNWDWEFNILNTSVAVGERLTGMAANQYFVSAKEGVTDAETKVVAKIKMNRFSLANNCNNGSGCSCTDESCSSNCCNFSLGGNDFNESADLFVFTCNNPWPSPAANGAWSPWYDSASNCNPADLNCANFNYKFYYCRDFGGPETSDDLPAILNQPLISGQNKSLVCSSDRSITCSKVGDHCGQDNNFDGQGDGVCMWGVLKESYFFREELPSAAELVSATDTKKGGEVELVWRSGTTQIDTYKLYYLKAGHKELLVKEYKPDDAAICKKEGQIYKCSSLINNLENNTAYIFKVGVLSSNKAEIKAANEITVVPTDRVAPKAPNGLKINISNDKIISVSWDKNNDDASFYRLYRGIESRKYANNFNSSAGNNYLRFLPTEFSPGLNYFSLSALDASNNESEKSAEVSINFPAELF